MRQTGSDLLPPEVPETTVSPDLLQPLQIFSQLVVQTVSEDLKRDTATVQRFVISRQRKHKCVSAAAQQVAEQCNAF